MIRGTRRPGGGGRIRAGSAGDMGDSLGPGEGCLKFLRELFVIAVVLALCAVCGLAFGGRR